MEAPQIVKVVNRVRYNTAKATLLAHDSYWDGHNFERHGRNTFLCRTAKGRYFKTVATMWQGEHDDLTPLTRDEACVLYEALREHEVEYEAAFDIDPEDA